MKEKDKITRLISKIIAGQATPEEEEYVQHYFGESRPHREWDSASMGDKDEVRENLKGKLIHQLQNRKIEPPKFRKLYSVFKVATVAAAVLIICLTGLHINSREKAKNDSMIVMENIIVPGSDKGSLTLSNGSKIDLEQIGAGESIHQEGMSVSKNMAGEINYSFINKSENGITINDPLTMNTLVTPLGGRLTIELADGTKVWLNSGSKLVFPNAFSAKLREVTVVGEAYFKVAKNEKQPFIVHTNKTQIKVLGTEFNVNAYSNEKQNITTLIEGILPTKYIFK